MTKKKTLYAIILQIHSNSKCILMQMYFNECMKSLILKSNLIQKGEKT